VSTRFLDFDEHPIAAASIAQVHRGRLNNNQEVAVKVQYPGLEWRVKLDIMTMSLLSKSVSLVSYAYHYAFSIDSGKDNISLLGAQRI
jgi:aarF domain-containing kinase